LPAEWTWLQTQSAREPSRRDSSPLCEGWLVEEMNQLESEAKLIVYPRFAPRD